MESQFGDVKGRSSKVALDARDFSVHEPAWNSLENATDEQPFMRDTIELLKNVGALSSSLAILVPSGRPHARDAAIRCGLLVRACKLAVALIRDACRDQGVLQIGLSRQLIETLANLKFLCNDHDGKHHQTYINDSLIAEREFLKVLRSNYDEDRKDGSPVAALAERIERSLTETARAAATDLDALPRRRDNDWPTAEDRIKAAYGSPDFYVTFRTGSSAVHGTWHDLYRNHLIEVPGGFEPETQPLPVRPQLLLGSTLLLADASLTYLSRNETAVQDAFSPPLREILTRALRVDELHEQFLQREN